MISKNINAKTYRNLTYHIESLDTLNSANFWALLLAHIQTVYRAAKLR